MVLAIECYGRRVGNLNTGEASATATATVIWQLKLSISRPRTVRLQWFPCDRPWDAESPRQ